jgi:redox-regulated HSP33 family molecular chaperone
MLLKSLSPGKDAVLVTVAAPALIQELWEGQRWVNPRVFLRAAQATLACLAVQGLGEEDSKQSLEMQWAWKNEGLHSLYVDSLFQGAVRASYSWTGEEKEEIPELHGTFQMRRKEELFETSGIVDSNGDIVHDVQNILLKSEQVDCALAVSIRWALDEGGDAAKLKITVAHAYLLHVLPPMMESQRDENLAHWQNFIGTLGAPAEWVISDDPQKAVVEMTNLIFASPKGMKIFSKPVMFFCSCTEEKILRILKTLPKDDIDSLDENLEVSCKYCGKIYSIKKPD